MFENINNRKKSLKYLGESENYEPTSNAKSVDSRALKAGINPIHTKYDSHSEFFKPTIKFHNTDFEYPLLSSRTCKYSSENNHYKKYLPNTSKNHKPSSSIIKQLLTRNKESSIWGAHDPYHSLANEQLAKDYLTKNLMKRSDEKAVEKIMTNLDKEKANNKSSLQSTTYNNTDESSTKKKIFNSINKWSNGLNKSSKEFKYLISLNDNLLTSRSVNYLVKTNQNSDQITIKPEISTTSKQLHKQANNINNLFNIIEKENTNFSIKSGYDTPLTCLDTGRVSAEPHKYMNIETNIKCSTKPEKVKKSIDSTYQVAQTMNNQTELYQKLEFPSQINLYSKLDTSNLSEFYRQDNRTKSVVRPLLRPKAGYQKRSTGYKSKSFSNSVLSFETEANNPDNECCGSAENFGSSLKGRKSLISSSLLASNSLMSLTDQQHSSQDLNLSQLVNITKLPFQAKSSLAKIVKISPSSYTTPKTSRPVKARPGLLGKNTPIKEFKSCILTDSKIGEGEFSELFQAYRFDLASPTKIAAKRLKVNQTNTNSINILSEISVLSQLGSHPNIIDFIGVYSFNNTMYIMLEFAEHGDLKHLLDRLRKDSLNNEIVVSVDTNFQIKASMDIASGMEYISSFDIVHKDLAARNVLVDSNFNCKICDFGSCNSSYAIKRPIR